ncbi:DNA ligase [Paenibacillus lutrae]|uniref:DNA ligase n=1 Tax=Paenibacillus lutrae TaxID=2078573 RepID=A0A7X3K1I0_9BACL|nr:DNA ligase [Paenibacillus lutrae]MVP02016.1 DNA ligase [Paenibacillus lutrae]
MQRFTPMSPILSTDIPGGDDWVYQLKWDGFRIIALVDQGRVELFSKKMLPKNLNYPDLVKALEKLEGSYVLDGEAVILDPATGKPSFQKMQQRDKLTGLGLINRSAQREPAHYMLFDLIQLGQEDLRRVSFQERYKLLQEAGASWEPPLYVTDLYEDGQALWDWAEANAWEGIISKRLSSPYRSGKDHHDWFKRKTVLRVEAQGVGVLVKEGRAASLVMRRSGRYFGRVSSGLSQRSKQKLLSLEAGRSLEDYFPAAPEGLRGMDVRWLEEPLPLLVTGREVTENGILRHPKLLSIGGIPL